MLSFLLDIYDYAQGMIVAVALIAIWGIVETIVIAYRERRAGEQGGRNRRGH
ncbi:MAG TPA: hypothetical protein VKY31_13590 [Terriglobia bacterium]|nr:hypothetical protein [Terriglobia bacterium]